mgnify:FL=1
MCAGNEGITEALQTLIAHHMWGYSFVESPVEDKYKSGLFGGPVDGGEQEVEDLEEGEDEVGRQLLRIQGDLQAEGTPMPATQLGRTRSYFVRKASTRVGPTSRSQQRGAGVSSLSNAVSR